MTIKVLAHKASFACLGIALLTAGIGWAEIRDQADPLTFRLGLTEPVFVDTAQGVPSLSFRLADDLWRDAPYAGGSGGQSLDFTYQITAGDFAPAGVVLNNTIALNGGRIVDVAGNPVALDFGPPDLSAIRIQTHSVTWDNAVISDLQAATVFFTLRDAPPGAFFDYTITPGDGAPAGAGGGQTGTGRVSQATQQIGPLDLSSLPDGPIELALILRDGAGNAGAPVRASALKDTDAPTGQGVAFAAGFDLIGANAVAAVSIVLSGLEAQGAYSLEVSSSGGGATVSRSGTATGDTVELTGIDLSSLPDGVLTSRLVVLDAAGNAAPGVTATAQKDTAAPAGYSVAWVTDPVNAGNATAAGFQLAAAEVGASYGYTITSSGGGAPVTGSGTVASADAAVTGLDLSGLADGTLTLSMTLTDAAGNAGTAVTDTAQKIMAVPTVVVSALTPGPTGASPLVFDIVFSEPMTGDSLTLGELSVENGTAANLRASDTVTFLVDVTPLGDGVVSLQVPANVAQSPAFVGNAASNIATTIFDGTAPAAYGVGFADGFDQINAAEAGSVDVVLTGLETGATYVVTLTSSGGGTPVTVGGTASDPSLTLAGLDLTGLADGTLTVTLVLTDAAGNAGPGVTDTAVKNMAAPAGYSVAWTTDPVNAGNATAAGFAINAAEVGAAYAYSITSDGGAGSASGEGTVAAADQAFTGVDLSILPDGSLTVSVTLTDAAGNTGAAVTATAQKDTAAPTGYSVAWITDPVNGGNVTAAGFQLAAAEVGAGYGYSITSSGGGAPVTGSGTVASADATVTGLDLSGLADGTLTVSVTLTDAAGNAGPGVTDTALKDTAAPIVLGMTPPADGTYDDL